MRKKLKFADIISNPVNKQSVCVKWKQKCDHSSSSSNRSVSVSQQSTLNSQTVHGLSRSIQPAVPTPPSTVATHQQVMTHMHYRATPTGPVPHYKWPVSLTCRPTSLRVPCRCLCQSATLCSQTHRVTVLLRLLARYTSYLVELFWFKLCSRQS